MTTATTHVRYQAECRCGRGVYSTPVVNGKVDDPAWVRCADCGHVVLAEKTGSETLGGGSA